MNKSFNTGGGGGSAIGKLTTLDKLGLIKPVESKATIKKKLKL